jgi:hypothetical protein
VISRLDPEPPSLSFINVLTCFHNFLRQLRSPVQFVLSQSPDPDPKAVSALTELWVKSSMSCDFFCFCDRGTFNFLPFTRAVNGSLTCYGAGERDKLLSDVVRRFVCARVRFPVADLGSSKSLRFVKVFGRGGDCEAHIFQMATLGVNDTLHFLVRPDIRKFTDVPPRIVFVIRYLDTQMQFYRRVIPIDCQSRLEDPEAVYAAVALLVATGQLDVQKGKAALACVNVSNFDRLFQARFRGAINALDCIPESGPIANFVIGRPAGEVLDRLSPISLEFGTSEWRAIGEVTFGAAPVIVKRPFHRFLIVLGDGEPVESNDWLAIIREIDKVGMYGLARAGEAAGNADWAEIRTLLALMRQAR